MKIPSTDTLKEKMPFGETRMGTPEFDRRVGAGISACHALSLAGTTAANPRTEKGFRLTAPPRRLTRKKRPRHYYRQSQKSF